MIRDFQMPPTGFGPGSQTDEGGETLEYMQMPSDMVTYAPRIPMVEETTGLDAALDLLAKVAAACARVADGGAPEVFDLSGLDADNRRLVAETMGEGEVAMKLHGRPALSVQESVFAGIWCITAAGIDRIEVAQAPEAARTRAFDPVRPASDEAPGPQVVNAPSLLAELTDKSAAYTGGTPHVVNLTLLPHTEGDLDWLDARLGRGATDILSRGYGNCRVQATATPHVWRVRFFNSMDSLILDTFEVGDLPEVALAAAEDLADSGKRLTQVREAIL
ncbi:hydrogenase expression/formation protein [Jannaschia pagri]|uniref:Hydrogenase expression/formation protein n=1 Tax=Jannaschia pagri TaxID=2829797 RepID=A0ABQ4NR28_9RHOB|nr:MULTISPECIES: hydrogenase expression/formation protein [unclassified Jannaschia]GIT93029.1 hydrogenase expression/formation protein [Jannaschia sp. AI_61]GIT96864.1 hydrogenase expression/formation protein [Jannaschia sp. AI_62]